MTNLTLDDVKLLRPPRRKKDRIQVWVDALRSGKYLQGKEHLSFQDEKGRRWRHCCLGVACIEAGIDLETETEERGYSPQFIRSYDETEYELPDSVIRWYGLSREDSTNADSDPTVRVIRGDRKGESTSLAGLNDDEDWTYAMIADLIERDWL